MPFGNLTFRRRDEVVAFAGDRRQSDATQTKKVVEKKVFSVSRDEHKLRLDESHQKPRTRFLQSPRTPLRILGQTELRLVCLKKTRGGVETSSPDRFRLGLAEMFGRGFTFFIPIHFKAETLRINLRD